VAQQGIYVFGGSNLSIGDTAGNRFNNIGTYGIYTGMTSLLPLTTGTILIENNIFGDVNVQGAYPISVISIGSPTITGQISGNVFDMSGNYALLTPYIRFGVL
jgi:hypothetical protein